MGEEIWDRGRKGRGQGGQEGGGYGRREEGGGRGRGRGRERERERGGKASPTLGEYRKFSFSEGITEP